VCFFTRSTALLGIAFILFTTFLTASPLGLLSRNRDLRKVMKSDALLLENLRGRVTIIPGTMNANKIAKWNRVIDRTNRRLVKRGLTSEERKAFKKLLGHEKSNIRFDPTNIQASSGWMRGQGIAQITGKTLHRSRVVGHAEMLTEPAMRSTFFESGMHELYHGYDDLTGHIAHRMYAKNPNAMLWLESRANSFAYGGGLTRGFDIAGEQGYLDTVYEMFPDFVILNVTRFHNDTDLLKFFQKNSQKDFTADFDIDF